MNEHKAAITAAEAGRVKLIARVAWVSIIGNALIAVSKIVVGWLAGSLSVLGDGIDSLGDIISSTLTLITSAIIALPPDERFPYGRQRADTVASKLLAFVIFFFGAQLSYSSLMSYINHEQRPVPGDMAVYVTILSVLVKLYLSWRLFRVGEKTKSSMLIANAKNMRSDIVISLVVLAGLFFSKVAGIGLIDLIFAFLVGLWIMRTAIEIFMETNLELMDGMDDKAAYFQVFDAVESVPGARNPHRTRIRKFANYYIIDTDIEVDGNLTVAEAHIISQKVEEAIKRRIENVYDIMVHIEPLGNVERTEKYGLSREQL